MAILVYQRVLFNPHRHLSTSCHANLQTHQTRPQRWADFGHEAHLPVTVKTGHIQHASSSALVFLGIHDGHPAGIQKKDVTPSGKLTVGA